MNSSRLPGLQSTGLKLPSVAPPKSISEALDPSLGQTVLDAVRESSPDIQGDLAKEFHSWKDQIQQSPLQSWKENSLRLCMEALQMGYLAGAGLAALSLQTGARPSSEVVSDARKAPFRPTRVEAEETLSEAQKRWFPGKFRQDLLRLYEIGHTAGVDLALRTPPPENLEPRPWTVLFFVNGSDSLEHTYRSHLHDLVDAATPESYLAVQAAWRSEKGQGFRARIESSAGVVDREMLGPTDMGSSTNLAEFLKWGMKNYPAQRYALVLQGHGGALGGILPDAVHKTAISVKELSDALGEAPAPFDLVVLDNCYMGEANVACQLAGSTRYLVASQEASFADDADYRGVLKDLAGSNGSLSARDLGSSVLRRSNAPTRALFDLEKSEPFVQAFRQLSQALLETPLSVDSLRSAVQKAEASGQVEQMNSGRTAQSNYRQLVDVASLCRQFSKLDDARIAGAAQEVAQQLKQFRVEGYRQEKYSPQAEGLAIYLPLDQGDWLSNLEEMEFARATGWDLVARKICGRLQELGVQFESEQNLTLKPLAEDSPAREAGLKGGDRVLGLAGKPTPDRRTFRAVFRELPPGQPVEVQVKSDGEVKTRTVKPRSLLARATSETQGEPGASSLDEPPSRSARP